MRPLKRKRGVAPWSYRRRWCRRRSGDRKDVFVRHVLPVSARSQIGIRRRSLMLTSGGDTETRQPSPSSLAATIYVALAGQVVDGHELDPRLTHLLKRPLHIPRLRLDPAHRIRHELHAEPQLRARPAPWRARSSRWPGRRPPTSPPRASATAPQSPSRQTPSSPRRRADRRRPPPRRSATGRSPDGARRPACPARSAAATARPAQQTTGGPPGASRASRTQHRTDRPANSTAQQPHPHQAPPTPHQP